MQHWLNTIDGSFSRPSRWKLPNRRNAVAYPPPYSSHQRTEPDRSGSPDILREWRHQRRRRVASVCRWSSACTEEFSCRTRPNDKQS